MGMVLDAQCVGGLGIIHSGDTDVIILTAYL